MKSEDQFQGLTMYRFFHLQKAIINRAKKMFACDHQTVQVEQVPVLLFLHFNGSGTQQEIANDIDRDKSSVLRTIASLEQKKLVMSASDPFDGRKKLLKLTKEGEKMAATIKEDMAEVDKTIFSALTDDEKSCFHKLLDKCAKAISEKPGN